MAAIRALVLVTATFSLAPQIVGNAQSVQATSDKPAVSKRPVLPPGTPAEQVGSLIKQYSEISDALQREFDAAKTEADQEKLLEKAPDNQAYATLLLKIAQQHPRESAAVDALIWIVRNAPAPGTKKDAPFAIAKTILLRDHLNDARIGLLCLTLRHDRHDPETLKVMHRVLDANPHKAAQAHAAFALAKMLRARAELAKHIQTADAVQFATYEKSEGHGVVAELKQVDIGAVVKESEALLERITRDKDFAETLIDYGARGRRLGELADAELFEMRHLQLGKVAPEITGEDLDGRPMKLSDYRGKVVLLDFWGHW